MNVLPRITIQASLLLLRLAILPSLILIGGCERPASPAKPVPAASTPAAASAAPIPATAKTVSSEPANAGPVDQSTASDPAQVTSVRVRVAAASDLRFVMAELQQEFNKQSPGISIDATFGSSGNLFAQISNRAPYDVFLSADIQYPEKLAEQKLIDPDSLFRYANGHIVLWVRKDSPFDVEQAGAEILHDPRLKKVAIANPKLAPYGRAAEAALKTLGQYDHLQEKLVLGESVAQTAQFAETGAADVAVIGKALAVAPQFVGKGKFWPFPANSYPPIEQAGVILAQAEDVVAARKFCKFLGSKAARQILVKFGFELPPG